MAKFLKFAFLALSLAALAACGKKEEEKPKVVEQAAVPVPSNNTDNQAWKLYLSSVVKKNMEGIRNSPYMYYLPAATGAAAPAEDGMQEGAAGSADQDEYDRQLDNVTGVVGRGVLPGNMLAFGSPDSDRMANLVVEAFTGVSQGSLKDVRVLFIGTAADAERVKAAVEPSGATFVFHEAR